MQSGCHFVMDMVRWIKQVGPIGGLIFIAKMNMAFGQILTLDDFDYRHRESGGTFYIGKRGFLLLLFSEIEFKRISGFILI